MSRTFDQAGITFDEATYRFDSEPGVPTATGGVALISREDATKLTSLAADHSIGSGEDAALLISAEGAATVVSAQSAHTLISKGNA